MTKEESNAIRNLEIKIDRKKQDLKEIKRTLSNIIEIERENQERDINIMGSSLLLSKRNLLRIAELSLAIVYEDLSVLEKQYAAIEIKFN